MCDLDLVWRAKHFSLRSTNTDSTKPFSLKLPVISVPCDCAGTQNKHVLSTTQNQINLRILTSSLGVNQDCLRRFHSMGEMASLNSPLVLPCHLEQS
jgi:hypothetical protein